MTDTTVLEDVYSNDTPLFWIFGILLTASAFPALILVPPKVTHDRIVVIVTLAFFALVGVLFLWAAIHASIRVRKFGPTTCHLDRPIHAGGQIHGELRTRMPALPRDGFLFDISCTHQTGRGKHATSGDLWTTRQRVPAEGIAPNPQGIRVPFVIEIPSSAVPSGEKPSDEEGLAERVYWTMNVSADVEGVDFRAQFPLLVLNP